MSEVTSPVEDAVAAFYTWKATQSEDTAREYRRHVNRFVQYLTDENSEVTVLNCDGRHSEGFYQQMLDDGYAPSSVRVAHAALSEFYKALDKFAEDGRRGFPEVGEVQDPTEYASPERLQGMHNSSKKDVEGGDKPLTREEVGELVNNVPQDKPIRNELMVRLLYQTGMRRSELVRVKLSHIDREERRIAVYGKKTEKARDVWYQPSLDTLLELWIDAERPAVFHAEDSPYLFPTRRSERMSEQTVSDVVTEAAENADLQETVYENRAGDAVNRVGAHTLRKSFGVHFINSGGDISLLADLLGHENIETTKQSYLKFSDKDLYRSVKQHGPSI